jgi:HAD superfamily phosphatase (TIGR01668 family)
MNVVKCYPTIADIDFEAWHKEAGVICVVTDMEGTLVEYGESTVYPEAIAALNKARDAGYISMLGIFTHNKNEDTLKSVVQQIEADACYIPASKKTRKPNPSMLYRAMSDFGVAPQQTGVIGDKLTADIKAGMRAGVARIAWVDRYGRSDHIGDRLFRRPYEAPTKAMIKRTDGRLY